MTQFHTEAFLTPEARREAAALPTSQRQKMIKTLLYKYPVFKEGLAFIESFHRPAGGDSHDTGCIGGLLGESRAGKTVICNYYASMHPNVVGEDGETFPVVHLEATEHMTPIHIAERLFVLTGARSVPKISAASLKDKSILRLAASKTQLLIIDDAQLLLFGRPRPQTIAMRSFIKQLADANLFNVFLVGDESLEQLVNELTSLANRGGFYHETIKPIGGQDKDFEMFRLLLDKIDERLPFVDKSGLNNALWARDFHHYSQGKIGRLMNLISRGAYMALKQDTSCIMVEHFREAIEHMRPPGDRYPYFKKG
jgi:hypothetical protein